MIFPTAAGFVSVMIVAAYHSPNYVGWVTAAAVTFALFAVYSGVREGAGPGRVRVSIGAIIGVGCLLMTSLALGGEPVLPGESSTEWSVIGMIVAMFVVRGRRRAGSPRTDPSRADAPHTGPSNTGPHRNETAGEST